MTNKLISLVLITFFLLISHSYSESQFLFPKKKPSVFSQKIENIGQDNLKNLPPRKPIIQEKQTKSDDTNNEGEDVKKIENYKKELRLLKIKMFSFCLKKNLQFIERLLRKKKNHLF